MTDTTKRRDQMTNLTDLLGEHMLDAVDFTCDKIHQYGDVYEDASVCRFRLDGVVYMAIEDPSDGYRSSLGSLIVPNDKAMGNVFPPVGVIGRMMADDEYEKHDVLELVDAFTGKVVLEVGTANTDDYYPSFVASFHPEAMATNADIVAHEEAEKAKSDGWTKKSKGNSKIYTHPGVPDGRAIVENHWGVTFNGVKYPSVDLAKIAALGGLA